MKAFPKGTVKKKKIVFIPVNHSFKEHLEGGRGGRVNYISEEEQQNAR